MNVFKPAAQKHDDAGLQERIHVDSMRRATAAAAQRRPPQPTIPAGERLPARPSEPSSALQHAATARSCYETTGLLAGRSGSTVLEASISGRRRRSTDPRLTGQSPARSSVSQSVSHTERQLAATRRYNITTTAEITSSFLLTALFPHTISQSAGPDIGHTGTFFVLLRHTSFTSD